MVLIRHFFSSANTSLQASQRGQIIHGAQIFVSLTNSTLRRSEGKKTWPLQTDFQGHLKSNKEKKNGMPKLPLSGNSTNVDCWRFWSLLICCLVQRLRELKGAMSNVLSIAQASQLCSIQVVHDIGKSHILYAWCKSPATSQQLTQWVVISHVAFLLYLIWQPDVLQSVRFVDRISLYLPCAFKFTAGTIIYRQRPTNFF